MFTPELSGRPWCAYFPGPVTLCLSLSEDLPFFRISFKLKELQIKIIIDEMFLHCKQADEFKIQIIIWRS